MPSYWEIATKGLMPAQTAKKRRPRIRSRRTRKLTKSTSAHPPQDLASLVRGLYARVARKLGVHPSYVSRVARSERESERVAAAIRLELSKILLRVKKQ